MDWMSQDLMLRATMMRREKNAKSTASIQSVPRAWHSFAVSVLQYEPEKTLPPRCSNDVEMYLALFHNAGTAANYLGHLRWVCKEYCLSMRWDCEHLKAQVDGV